MVVYRKEEFEKKKENQKRSHSSFLKYIDIHILGTMNYA